MIVSEIIGEYSNSNSSVRVRCSCSSLVAATKHLGEIDEITPEQWKALPEYWLKGGWETKASGSLPRDLRFFTQKKRAEILDAIRRPTSQGWSVRFIHEQFHLLKRAIRWAASDGLCKHSTVETISVVASEQSDPKKPSPALEDVLASKLWRPKASETIVFGYIVLGHPNWTAKEQRELIQRCADSKLFGLKLAFYEESAIDLKRPFVDRPMGYTIFDQHSEPGDHLIAVTSGMLFRCGPDRQKRVLREKLNVYFATNRRGRKPPRRRGSYAERERKRKGVPLGWALHNGELIPDQLMRALGKIAQRFDQLRIRIPSRPELLDLAYAANHQFPKESVPPDGDPRRKLNGVAVNQEFRLELLTFIEDHPNIRRQAIRESFPEVEAKTLHDRIKRLKRGKLISIAEDRRYSITVAGREYARSLHAQIERFSPAIVLPLLGNQRENSIVRSSDTV